MATTLQNFSGKLWFAGFFCLNLFITTVFAERTIETEGSAAIINGATQLAKQHAIKNAVQQAMLQTEAKVDSSSTVSENVLIIDSVRVSAAGTVEDVQILDEWTTGDTYHVRIRAIVPHNKIRKPNPAARYRKKIAALQFQIINRTHTYDLPNIEHDLPRELLRRLELTGEFIAVDATAYLIPEVTPQVSDYAKQINHLSETLGAQIIINGVIRDLGVHKQYVVSKARQVEIELTIYDGFTGARIAQHRFSEKANHAGYLKPNTTLFSQADFYQTNFGRVLERILKRQVEFVQSDLLQIPFLARVLQVEGKKIFFNAGGV
ncbi:MAG: flagellar assembly protein T N-terminal domain-containing protein, partial [Gammaproteobacteria bacterium]|nr:flagellar assembly protein T N-terminal domain-containing protein [Gammaproteobacteria bacterium]